MFGSRYDSSSFSNILSSSSSSTHSNSLNSKTKTTMTSNVASATVITASTTSTNRGAASSSLIAAQGATKTTSLPNDPTRRASVAVTSAASIQQKQPIANKIAVMSNNNVLALKNKLLCDLTHAIQMAQKFYLERNDSESRMTPLTNSDYQVHELCQQFDLIFLYGYERSCMRINRYRGIVRPLKIKRQFISL